MGDLRLALGRSLCGMKQGGGCGAVRADIPVSKATVGYQPGLGAVGEKITSKNIKLNGNGSKGTEYLSSEENTH